LWSAFTDRMAALGDVAKAAEAIPAETDVAWTGRTMKVPRFAEHMREELVLHGWDITGDNPAAQARLAQPWMTYHSVYAIGTPLLTRGVKELGADEHLMARLRVPGRYDVALTADAGGTTIDLASPDGVHLSPAAHNAARLVGAPSADGEPDNQANCF
jgi:hypothetical protein